MIFCTQHSSLINMSNTTNLSDSSQHVQRGITSIITWFSVSQITTFRKHFSVISPFITCPEFATSVTRRVPLVEQELSSLPELLSSYHILVGLVLLDLEFSVQYFVDRCLSFFIWPLCCLFFFDSRILTTPLAFANSSCYL
jgi:hypothetical protein